MTDLANGNDSDHFWARVRMALGVMRPVSRERQPAYGQAAIARQIVALPDLPVLLAKTSAGHIAEAIRGLALAHKESHAGIVTVSMGLAVTNPHGQYDRKFFETAAAALKKAQRKGLGRLHSIDLRPAQEQSRKKRAA